MKITKIHFGSVLFLLSALAVFFGLLIQVATAETLSTHNEEQAAYNAAIRAVMDRGCEPQFRRIQAYVVDVTPERVTIIAKEVAQDCAVPEAPKAAIRNWQSPVAREDGTPLEPSEIRGYQITVDGAVVMLAPVTTYQFDAGAKSAVIKTVDTDGQLSKAVGLL